MPSQAVWPHTRRWRLLKSICENDINEVKLVLDEDFDVNQIIDFKYNMNPIILSCTLNRTSIL